MVFWELQPEPELARLRTPHTWAVLAPLEVKAQWSSSTCLLTFPHSPRVSAPLTGPSTVPSTQAHPPQDPCGAKPHLEGSLPFIHGTSLTDGHHWSLGSASAPTPSLPAPHPSSHISSALISPLDFIRYTLPPSPQHKLHESQHLYLTATCCSPTGCTEKAHLGRNSSYPCRKDSEAPILQIRVITVQKIPFQLLMLKSLNGMRL